MTVRTMFRAVMAKAERAADRDFVAPLPGEPFAAQERAYRRHHYVTGRWSALAVLHWPVRVLLLFGGGAGAGSVARAAARTFLSAMRDSWSYPLSVEDRVRLERSVHRLLVWSRFASIFAIAYPGAWLARFVLAGEWDVFTVVWFGILCDGLYVAAYSHALRNRVTEAVRQAHGWLHEADPHVWPFAPVYRSSSVIAGPQRSTVPLADDWDY